MHIGISNPRKLNKGNHRICPQRFPICNNSLRKPLEMYIRIACNLKNLSQEAIGLAHSDCQTGEAKPKKPSDMQIRIANLEKLKPGSHRICTCGLPI